MSIIDEARAMRASYIALAQSAPDELLSSGDYLSVFDPVSYTHLAIGDAAREKVNQITYALGDAETRADLFNNKLCDNDAKDKPVSYTHLDVYKRQIINHTCIIFQHISFTNSNFCKSLQFNAYVFVQNMYRY